MTWINEADLKPGDTPRCSTCEAALPAHYVTKEYFSRTLSEPPGGL